jgi:hypothetical protein
MGSFSKCVTKLKFDQEVGVNPRAFQITVDRFKDAILTQLDNRDRAENAIFWSMHVVTPLDTESSPAHLWLNFLCTIDPTPKSIYVKWILHHWLRGEFGPLNEDVSKISDPLAIYDKVKARLPERDRDINRFKTVAAFLDMIKAIPEDLLPSKREQERADGERMIRDGHVTIYHDDDDIRIVIPHTKEAAIYHGRNTRWCTSATTYNYFDSYNISGPLYIILFKATNTRWQFHFQTGQLMDAEDERLKLRTIIKSRVHTLFDWPEIATKNTALAPLWLKAPASLRKAALEKLGTLVSEFYDVTDAEKRIAVRAEPALVREPRFDKPHLREIALSNGSFVLQYLNNPTVEECNIALHRDGRTLRWVPRNILTERMCENAIVSAARVMQRSRGIVAYDPSRGGEYGYGYQLAKRDGRPPSDYVVTVVPVDMLTPRMLDLHCQTNNIRLEEFDLEIFDPETMPDFKKLVQIVQEFFDIRISRPNRYDNRFQSDLIPYSHSYLDYDKYDKIMRNFSRSVMALEKRVLVKTRHDEYKEHTKQIVRLYIQDSVF